MSGDEAVAEVQNLTPLNTMVEDEREADGGQAKGVEGGISSWSTRGGKRRGG